MIPEFGRSEVIIYPDQWWRMINGDYIMVIDGDEDSLHRPLQELSGD